MAKVQIESQAVTALVAPFHSIKTTVTLGVLLWSAEPQNLAGSSNDYVRR